MYTKQPTLAQEPRANSIPGYDYGRRSVGRSPVSLQELREIEAAVGWSDQDAHTLQRHGSIFLQNAEKMVDTWRAVIGAQEHLAKWFFGPDGRPDDEYKARVKQRFVKWVVDACFRPHDQEWLDYQEEIGRRHTPEMKNKTDEAQAPPLVPLRYLIAFAAVVTTTTTNFFVSAGVNGDELRRLEAAWQKAVQLHITLWARPYTREGLW